MFRLGVGRSQVQILSPRCEDPAKRITAQMWNGRGASRGASVRVSGVEDRVVEPFRTTCDHPVTCTRRSFAPCLRYVRPPACSVALLAGPSRLKRRAGKAGLLAVERCRSDLEPIPPRQMPASRHKRARVDAASRRSLLVPKRDPARARRGCPHLSDSGSRRLPIDRCGARRVGLRGSPSVSWTRAAAGTLRRRRLRHVAHRAIR